MKNKFLLLIGIASLAVVSVANAGVEGGATINASISIVPSLDISNGTINFGKITTFSTDGNVTVAVNHDGTLDANNTTASVLALPSVTPVRITAPDDLLYYNESMTSANTISMQVMQAGDEVQSYNMQIMEYQMNEQEVPQSLLDSLAAAEAALASAQAQETYYNDLLGGGYASSSYNGWTAELSNTTFNLTSGNDICGTVTLSTPKWKLSGTYDDMEQTGSSYIDLSYAGTFVLKPGYRPDSETSCTGSTTLTIITGVQ